MGGDAFIIEARTAGPAAAKQMADELTDPPSDAALQDALLRLEASQQRQLELVRRVVHLTREREKMDDLARRQAAELRHSREALVAAERHLLVAKAARVAQWEWDIASGKVALEARWNEMIGAAPDHGWDLRALLARVHPDDVPRVRRALDDTLAGRADRYLAEHRVSGSDGWIWIESIGIVTERDAEGRPLRLTGFNSDITARRRMHADIEQARAQAEASNRAKSEFLANMSHEVRTPLNAVMGLTRLLHQSPLNDEQRHHLELIDSSATSLLALLNDMLDLSKIEAGKLVFEQVRFDLGRWVREAVALHTPAARKKGLKVDVDIAEDVPWRVAGDPGRLRQVISNLVSNAVKFTDVGRISVTVRLAADQAGLQREQLRLLFAVRDTGVGIPQDKQEHIFEAFTQADASVTRRYGGTGLGLAICERLVSMMGGSLHVTSRPDEGSTFRFTAVFEQAADELSVLTEPAPLEAMTMQGLDVLLAEDHAVNELLMRKLLTEMGCTFSVARNGEEAVRAWETGQFDLVLMDVQMPVLSGLDAAAHIRLVEASEPGRGRTPIVALTAHAMAGDRERCLAAGMDAYVSKPVSPALLAQAIQEAMRSSQPAQKERRRESPADSAPGAQAVDMQQMVRTMGGDLEAVHEIAIAMRSDMAIRRHLIRQAIGNRDARGGQEEIHALKGALSTIGAHPAAELAKRMEMAWRQGDWEQVRQTVSLLEQELERVDSVLADLVDG
ncbi:MAG: response regulator [Variovorax sp.]|nr:MAG: response regulator [Variovorax sp.]